MAERFRVKVVEEVYGDLLDESPFPEYEIFHNDLLTEYVTLDETSEEDIFNYVHDTLAKFSNIEENDYMRYVSGYRGMRSIEFDGRNLFTLTLIHYVDKERKYEDYTSTLRLIIYGIEDLYNLDFRNFVRVNRNIR